MAEVKLDISAQNIEDGWSVFHLTKLEVSVTVAPKNYESRKVTATFEPPETAPLRVVVPLHPGNGTQPKNTLALIQVQDQAQKMIESLESAIDKSIHNKKGAWE